jgi:thiol:disulfide interchange protein DsbD
MALPYLVLAAWPSLIARVPRTGPGSELLKQVMGLLMLAAATYFVGTGVSGLLAVPGQAPTRLYWWAVAACLAAAGVWLAWRVWRITGRTGPRVIFTSIAAAAIAAALGIGLYFTAPGPINWLYYTPDRFAAAMADDKVVVLEFTAEWCLNCKALEHTVLNDRQVVAALHAADVIPIKVDLTGDNPAGNARLAAVGRLTIPLLVIYDRNGEPIFTRDFYTVSQVLATIAQARGG